MRFEVDGRSPVENVKEATVRSAILRLRSYGPSSFASLTNKNGDYLQIAGGGVTCMLERRDSLAGRHYRGYQDRRSKVFPDGTVLVFSGGEIPLAADEWFTSEQVLMVFIAFLKNTELPDFAKWRDITDVVYRPD